ncbi:hypothetical protein B0I35DRAFT_414435 [Stachybotrys elegans]|uniref:Uncharacterized protein n=1 Tax=Stachybotrys elegans TaxID=80388 RepID=A0A8K0SAB5_9HYPO|nr:hypothetical protein B0I35DRAFT_414435 [Stachybotrys elegans]
MATVATAQLPITQPDPKDSKSDSQNHHSNGLPSPRATPDVDPGRIQAEAARQQASEKGEDPVEQEIKRVMLAPKDAYANILAVTDPLNPNEVINQWFYLGCMLHPKFCQKPDAEDAYKRVRTAAKKMHVDKGSIEQVKAWDGKTILKVQEDEEMRSDDDDSSESDDDGSGPKQKEDTVLDPKGKEDTVLDPRGTQDEGAIEEVKKLNSFIEENHPANKKEPGEKSKAPKKQWQIPLDWFLMQYKDVNEQYDAFVSKPNDETKKKVESIYNNIHHCIERDHFPQNWGVMFKMVVYPWNTGKAADGSMIIGVRRNGAGHRVCVETKEEGRLIRRIISASKAGFKQVKEYTATEYFNLAGQQSKWTYEDRENFEEVLWVTEAQGGIRNAAANQNKRFARLEGEVHGLGMIMKEMLTILAELKSQNSKDPEKSKNPEGSLFMT